MARQTRSAERNMIAGKDFTQQKSENGPADEKLLE
jgi:hypothetical protein